jgi:hypothetical protein
MMNASFCNFGKITAIASFIFVGAVAWFDPNTVAVAQLPSTEATDLSGNTAGGQPTGEEPEDKVAASGFFPVEAIHGMIREEREKTLQEVDKYIKALLAHVTQERQSVLLEIENLHKASLSYVTGERNAIMEQLIAESNRITNLLVAERRTTMLELEVAGNRIVEGALQSSERLIDYIFIRLSQLLLVVVVGLSIIAWIILRFFVSRSKVS